MERHLGGLERQFYQQNLIGSTHMCAHLRIDAPLDHERLTRATRDLGLRYPLLRASVVADPFLRFSLAGAPETLSLSFEERQSNDQWRRVLEMELIRPYGLGMGLATVRVLEDEEGSDILIGCSHILADGLSLQIICRTFLELYNGAVLGPASEGGPMEPRFPPSYRSFRGWWKAFKFIFTLGKLGPALQLGTSEITRTTLSQGFIFLRAEELNTRARARGSNLFAVFSAVALQAIFELYGQNPEEALSLNTPVSLRAQIPNQADEIGVFLAGHLALYKLTAKTDSWELARQCFDTLKQGIKEGRPYLLTLLARGARKPKPPVMSSRMASHRPTISISNLGRCEDFPRLGEAKVTEHHMVSAQSAKDPFAFVLLSYQGRLAVDLQTSFEKMGLESGQSILSLVQDKLEALMS